MNSDQSYISYNQYKIESWGKTDPWVYHGWNQVPWRSKHPLSMGHTRRGPYISISKRDYQYDWNTTGKLVKKTRVDFEISTQWALKSYDALVEIFGRLLIERLLNCHWNVTEWSLKLDWTNAEITEASLTCHWNVLVIHFKLVTERWLKVLYRLW